MNSCSIERSILNLADVASQCVHIAVSCININADRQTAAVVGAGASVGVTWQALGDVSGLLRRVLLMSSTYHITHDPGNGAVTWQKMRKVCLQLSGLNVAITLCWQYTAGQGR
ncbi:hypothetical protein J6590_026316 [Homalodisca vitripennis]|nr:hypothetical protein J6590_026316 [Homalodisca vitripennis]